MCIVVCMNTSMYIVVGMHLGIHTYVNTQDHVYTSSIAILSLWPNGMIDWEGWGRPSL